MISIPVMEASQVADARRRALAVAQRLGFDDTATGRVGIVVTELSTNLVKYGSAGEILLDAFEDETGSGVEVIALDKGVPALATPPKRCGTGTRPGGSAGTGLGAVQTPVAEPSTSRPGPEKEWRSWHGSRRGPGNRPILERGDAALRRCRRSVAWRELHVATPTCHIRTCRRLDRHGRRWIGARAKRGAGIRGSRAHLSKTSGRAPSRHSCRRPRRSQAHARRGRLRGALRSRSSNLTFRRHRQRRRAR